MFRELFTSQAVELLINDSYANWSYNGATRLVEYLEEFELSMGEPYKFETTLIRCTWSEYESEDDVLNDFDVESINELSNKTTVIPFDGRFLIEDF